MHGDIIQLSLKDLPIFPTVMHVHTLGWLLASIPGRILIGLESRLGGCYLGRKFMRRIIKVTKEPYLAQSWLTTPPH